MRPRFTHENGNHLGHQDFTMTIMDGGVMQFGKLNQTFVGALAVVGLLTLSAPQTGWAKDGENSGSGNSGISGSSNGSGSGNGGAKKARVKTKVIAKLETADFEFSARRQGLIRESRTRDRFNAKLETPASGVTGDPGALTMAISLSRNGAEYATCSLGFDFDDGIDAEWKVDIRREVKRDNRVRNRTHHGSCTSADGVTTNFIPDVLAGDTATIKSSTSIKGLEADIPVTFVRGRKSD
jgi:hypothetical protein